MEGLLELAARVMAASTSSLDVERRGDLFPDLLLPTDEAGDSCLDDPFCPFSSRSFCRCAAIRSARDVLLGVELGLDMELAKRVAFALSRKEPVRLSLPLLLEPAEPRLDVLCPRLELLWPKLTLLPSRDLI